MTEEVDHSRRDALSGAIINVQEARIQLESGSLARADEALAVSQRLLLRGGAKDIGPLKNGRDLEDNVLSHRSQLRRKVERKEERIEELEAELEELKQSEEEDEQDSGLFSFNIL